MPVGPFISYYGSKWRASRLYDPPRFGTIIEPFAGSAGYSCRYFDLKVILVDRDPIIAGIWDYLIKASSEEILRLPAPIKHIDEVHACQEAKWLVGFWINCGAASPCNIPSKWNVENAEKGNASAWGPKCKERIARSQKRIRHWKIRCASYMDIEDLEGTWFVDPPYAGKPGSHYRFGSGGIDYTHLGEWCRGRKGQVQVCEASGADWLPFEDFLDIRASPGRYRTGVSEEVVWRSDVIKPNMSILDWVHT